MRNTAAVFFVAALIVAAALTRAEETEKKEAESPEKEKAGSPEKAATEEKADDKKEGAEGDGKKAGAAVLDAKKDAAADAKKKPRSLLQACKKEAKRLCGEGLAVAKCLSDKASSIEDEVCKEWVESRTTCLADAEKSGKCAKKETPRACLRKLTVKDVSDKCGQSDFFKAVQMYTRWRRRHEPAGKTGAPGAPAVTKAADKKDE
jgi:hypothetical protein